MNIGIDISQTAFRGTGVARYTASLVRAVTMYDKNNKYIFFYSSLRTPLDAKLRDIIYEHGHTVKEFHIPPTLLSLLWNRMRIMSIENFIGDVDIFMTSDWTEPPAKRALKVSTLHDMIIYKYPETSQSSTMFNVRQITISPNIVAQQKQRHALLKKESHGLFVDSKHTKKDAIEHLNIDKDRLHLLYPAVEIVSEGTSWKLIKEKYDISKPYILTVGKLEPRKNISALISAFTSSALADTDLYIVGDKGWGSDPKKHVPGVRFLNYVADEDLATLYKHAEFFVFPSLYEGFGYPVIEAMGYGCPVACSHSSSLHEIGDNAALLFNPHDINDLIKTLKRMHEDTSLRSTLSAKGYERYKSFSLEYFARNFVKIVQEIYNDNRR